MLRNVMVVRAMWMVIICPYCTVSMLIMRRHDTRNFFRLNTDLAMF